MAMKWTE